MIQEEFAYMDSVTGAATTIDDCSSSFYLTRKHLASFYSLDSTYFQLYQFNARLILITLGFRKQACSCHLNI